MNIVVLLILTILLYRLLFSNFGFMSEKDKKRQEAASNFVKSMNKSQKNVDIPIIGDKEIFDKMYDNYTKKTKFKISKADKKQEEFDEKAFIKISEKTITKISEAFSEKNAEALEKMLTKDLFKIFKEKIDNMHNQIYKSVIVYFKDISIENKKITKKTKVVSLRVKTEQVNYIEDESGNIINGSKDKPSEITELWTFVQSQSSNNNIPVIVWLLESIDNVQI